MPTQKVDRIYNTNRAPNLEALLVRAESVLMECFNRGTALAELQLNLYPEINYSNMAPILIFRQSLELIFGLSKTIRDCNIGSFEILCRCLIEYYFNLKYILASDRDIRSENYVIAELHKKLETFDYFQEGTNARQRLDSAVRADTTVTEIRQPPDGLLENSRNGVESAINSNELQNAKQRYDASHNKNWYALGGGPGTVEQLARQIGDSASYEVLYRIFSGRVHGNQLMSVSLSANDIVGVNQPIMLQGKLKNGIMFSVNVMDTLSDSFAEGHPIHDAQIRWYSQEVRDFVNAL